jgi:hypothetical protein
MPCAETREEKKCCPIIVQIRIEIPHTHTLHAAQRSPSAPPPNQSNHPPKRRNQRLRQPKTEHQLRPRHQHLGRQPLKKTSKTLIPNHTPHNPKPTLRTLKIPILNPRLNHIQRRRHNERRRRTTNRRHEILRPARRIIILQMKNLLLCEGRAAEEGERPRRIASGGPPRAAVQPHPLVGDDAEEATGAEGSGVGLAFDLEDVEGEEDDLADADEGAGGGV